MTKRAKHTRARYAAERGRNRERVRTRRQPRRSMSCCYVAALPLSTTTTTPRRDAEHRRWQRNSAVLCEGCVCLCASLLILHCILILRARISHSTFVPVFIFVCVRVWSCLQLQITKFSSVFYCSLRNEPRRRRFAQRNLIPQLVIQKGQQPTKSSRR